MDRAARFIQLYNRMSDHLREVTDADSRATFSEMVNRAAQEDSAIRAAAGRLKEYGDLRNAIIHHRDYPQTIIAEPSEAALADFAAVVERALAPKRLLPTFRRQIRLFATGEPLIEALRYMGAQGFSQVVIRERGELALLTAEGVGRWLARHAEAETVDLAGATIADALAHDIPHNFVVLGRNRTIYDAHDAFNRSLGRKQPRLYAIIVTENGRPTEHPLGLVTAQDLLENDDL